MERIVMTLSLLVGIMFFNAQEKKKVDVEAYYEWKYVSSEQITGAGDYVVYIEKSYRGNDSLYLKTIGGKDVFSYGRVGKTALDLESRFLLFDIKTDYDSVRKLKVAEKKKDEFPKDSLGLFLLKEDSLLKFGEVAKWQVAEEGGDFILIEREDSYKSDQDKSTERKKKCFLFKGKSKKDQIKKEEKGYVVTMFHLTNDSLEDIKGVFESSISHFGNTYAFVQNFVINDSIDSASLSVGSLKGRSNVFLNAGEIKELKFDRSGEKLVFLATEDTSKIKSYALYLYDLRSNEISVLVDTFNNDLKTYQSIAQSPGFVFSKNGSKLFFNAELKRKKEKEDSIPADEKYKLDLWSWTDGELQPQQLLSAKKDVLGNMQYVYDFNQSKSIAVNDTSSQNLRFSKFRNGDYAILSDQSNYLKEMTYDYWYYDVFRVDLRTGKKKQLLTHYHGGEYGLSPSGQYFTYWSHKDSCWYLQDLNADNTINLTGNIEDEFYEAHHDVAQKIGAAGGVKWLEGESQLAIESQTDIWLMDPLANQVIRITNGKENQTRYRMTDFEDEHLYYSIDRGIYVKSFHLKNKAEGIAFYDQTGLRTLNTWDRKIVDVKKAKNSGHVLIQNMDFTHSPDVYVTDTTFAELKQLSFANPQQENYVWGTVEIVDWVDYNGDSVSGLLYKPEGFNSGKSYPMMVYFYERYTDRLHFYYRPKPTASIIYPSEYVSNGYVVFIPDIKYEIGHPAKSAFNAIMSGTDAMLEKHPNIDSTRMALQGQSWGGYQTAQMVTMTNRYKCAMAGAPVSNMFSAYGGIRWGSGLSRAFQYETGQSRIGESIWDTPELYIENSPIFHLPKVETPLLIMHNDGDGAVPWYQGIELFSGLRRLNKPAWLLNYNDDEHNLMKDANRMDLSIRMRQFFDHYLLDAPAPVWMEKGLPAMYKGEKDHY